MQTRVSIILPIRWLFALLVGLLTAPCCAADISRTDVFTSGTDGYAVFRIPAIVASTSGTLLAFAEGRKDSGSDTGRIDTVLRRSFDGGKSWGPLQIVWHDEGNTCGNPAPVVDSRTGRVVLLGTWNRGEDKEVAIANRKSRDTRRVFVTVSADDGATWLPHREITESVKKPDWGWYATGPCHGIQMTNGRLVVPCNHTPLGGKLENSQSHVITSDDGGESWLLGGIAPPPTNESTVAQLSNGNLLLNMRCYTGDNLRAVSRSSDGGTSWSALSFDPPLVEPVCQGSLLRISSEGRAAFVFSNPASTKRENLTVRISRDDCTTWSDGLLLQKGFSAYSDLTELTGKRIGCLYEGAQDGKSYGRISFAVIPVSSLED